MSGTCLQVINYAEHEKLKNTLHLTFVEVPVDTKGMVRIDTTHSNRHKGREACLIGCKILFKRGKISNKPGNRDPKPVKAGLQTELQCCYQSVVRYCLPNLLIQVSQLQQPSTPASAARAIVANPLSGVNGRPRGSIEDSVIRSWGVRFGHSAILLFYSPNHGPLIRALSRLL